MICHLDKAPCLYFIGTDQMRAIVRKSLVCTLNKRKIEDVTFFKFLKYKILLKHTKI